MATLCSISASMRFLQRLQSIIYKPVRQPPEGKTCLSLLLHVQNIFCHTPHMPKGTSWPRNCHVRPDVSLAARFS
jgi:hypothetical protein